MTENPSDYRGKAVPYLLMKSAAEAIEFYKQAFGAEEVMRFPMPDGGIGHAEIRIQGAPVFLADESPEATHKSARQVGAATATICIYLDDVDAFAKRAESAGASVLRPLADQFYGERSVVYTDPYGYIWNFSTVTEELTQQEMLERMERMAKA